MVLVREKDLRKAIKDIYIAMTLNNHVTFRVFRESPVRLDIGIKIGKQFGSLTEIDYKEYLDPINVGVIIKKDPEAKLAKEELKHVANLGKVYSSNEYDVETIKEKSDFIIVC